MCGVRSVRKSRGAWDMRAKARGAMQRGDMPDGGRYARRARGMRLYGAWAVSGRSCGGEGDMRADGARRDMGDTDIKKTPYREI